MPNREQQMQCDRPERRRLMQSWQIFYFARKHLGREELYEIFGRKNARVVDYWSQDPGCTDKPDAAYDPIRGLKNLLERLDDMSHFGVVRATVAYLLSGTSMDCGEPLLVELLPTIEQEQLADYRALGVLQNGIEDGLSCMEIDALKAAAIAEIERTVAKYKEDFDK